MKVQKVNKTSVTTKQVFFLKGKKTTLRPARESDIPYFIRWMNDPEVRIFVNRFFPLTEGEEKVWFDNLSKNTDKSVFLVIEVKGKPIGTMGVHNINWIDRVGTTGAIIGEKEYWDKGYGTDAKMVFLDYLFNTLNLRKIMSQVKAFNGRSVAYSLHCGYKVEGRLRKHLFTNGEYHDEVLLGLFREEWLPYWKKYQKSMK